MGRKEVRGRGRKTNSDQQENPDKKCTFRISHFVASEPFSSRLNFYGTVLPPTMIIILGRKSNPNFPSKPKIEWFHRKNTPRQAYAKKKKKSVSSGIL